MTLANAHSLFCGLKAEPSFLSNLTVEDQEKANLMAARQEVRTTLKAAASQIAVQDDYWQPDYARRVGWRNRLAIQVKFMTQGSFAYGTLNAPAHVPKQEIDLDDGMYVPVEFLDGQPALAAKGLFAFVEAALAPLCRARGWTLDTSKDTCVRVKLWAGAHIDLPIYSMPRDRFETITESVEKSIASASFARDSMTETWRLPPDQIMLAQRDGTWLQSDPQQLHDWVKGRSDRYGPVYRRLCRFFKGWRDFTWQKSVLSSLCVMCAVDVALRDMGQAGGFPTESRDDELLMEIAKRLPGIFSGKVENPVIKNLCLNEWDVADRRAIVHAAEGLRDEMISALERTGDAEMVVRKLRETFGSRIPYRPDSVKIASRIAAIKSAPAATVAAPSIIASTSG